MTALLPGFEILAGLRGRVRTIGDPDRAERNAARQARYRMSAKYRARVAATRLERAAYHRDWYRRNAETRRPYLAAKGRERRARLRAARS